MSSEEVRLQNELAGRAHTRFIGGSSPSKQTAFEAWNTQKWDTECLNMYLNKKAAVEAGRSNLAVALQMHGRSTE